MARQSRYTTAGRRQASRAADAVSKKPVNSVAPAITGTATEGETLTCSSGTWSKSPSFSYQWQRDGSPIIGATANTRVLDEDDVGAVMSCTVKATKSGVSAVRTSAATAEVEAAE
jgi:hypothetical protein